MINIIVTLNFIVLIILILDIARYLLRVYKYEMGKRMYLPITIEKTQYQDVCSFVIESLIYLGSDKIIKAANKEYSYSTLAIMLAAGEIEQDSVELINIILNEQVMKYKLFNF